MGKWSGYRERDNAAAVSAHANQQGGNFDGIIKQDFPVWRIPEGKQQVRILPPTWEDTETWGDHWSITVWVHGNVGADNGQYLCPKKMLNEDCPICEEAARLKADGDDELFNQIKANKRVLVWMIDRKNEEAGPQVWNMSWSTDKDIATRCQSQQDNSVIVLDHPDDGYDLFFKREGTGLNTRYPGMDVARDPSYISKDEDEQIKWLDYIAEHPLPSILNYQTNEYLEKVLAGTVARSNKEDEDKGGRGRGRDDDRGRGGRGDDRGRGRGRGSEPERTRDDTRSSRGSRRDDPPDDEPEEEERGRGRGGRDDGGREERGGRGGGREEARGGRGERGSDRGSSRGGREESEEGSRGRGERGEGRSSARSAEPEGRRGGGARSAEADPPDEVEETAREAVADAGRGRGDRGGRGESRGRGRDTAEEESPRGGRVRLEADAGERGGRGSRDSGRDSERGGRGSRR